MNKPIAVTIGDINGIGIEILIDLFKNNKIILTFVALFVIFISYLLLPTFYDQKDVSKELKNQLESKFDLNFKFSENIFLNDLASNLKIVELLKSNEFVDWEVDYKYVNIIYDKIINSEIYDSYMKSKINSFADDLKFVYDIFKDLIIADEKFQSFIEEKNIYWMDDFPLVNTLLLKYLKNSTKNNYEKSFHFKLFSNKSDKKYADDLANHSLRNFESNNELINKYAANWDIDRLAKVDLVIINLAISELKEFRDIPVKVTLNEYIEISKDYSTEKSSFFINGILDKIVKDLIKNNQLLLDGSHNEDGARVLNEYLQTLDCNKHFIIGMMSNKNHEEYISHFKDISSLTTVDIPNQQNAISGKKLKEKFQNVFNAKYEDNVEKAIKSLSLKENDMLIITGSLYLAGEILNLN